MKLALVRQGMYRDQENSHLGWPDHTWAQMNIILMSCNIGPRSSFKSVQRYKDISRSYYICLESFVREGTKAIDGRAFKSQRGLFFRAEEIL